MKNRNRIRYIVGITKLNGYLLVTKTKDIVNGKARYKTNWYNQETKDWIYNKLTTNIPTCAKLSKVKNQNTSELYTTYGDDSQINNFNLSYINTLNSSSQLSQQLKLEFKDSQNYIGRYPQTVSKGLKDKNENIKVGDTYVFHDSIFLRPKLYAPKNAILIVKKIKIKKDEIGFYIQGGFKLNWFTKSNFNEFPITKQSINQEYLANYVRPSEGFVNISNFTNYLIKLFKKHPELHQILIKLKKDSSYSKGNTKAANFNEVGNKQTNSEDTKSGFNSKGYTWWENRSGRTTPVPTPDEIKIWENSENKHPLGIKPTEQCTFSQMEKIMEKLLSELCGMYGVPDEFIKEVVDFGIKPTPKHIDYWTGKQITLHEIRKNKHHSKEKGIEFCHIDPKKGTTVDNVTFGLSTSNRKQGGNSIGDLAFESANALRMQEGFESITEEEYRKRVFI